MTLKELKNRVFSAAHITGEGGDLLFREALTTALFSLYAELKPTLTRSIFINPIDRIFTIPRLILRCGETKTLPLTGRAYSMRLSGAGEIAVRDGIGVLRRRFDTEDLLIRDFIGKGGDMELYTDKGFTVYDFTLYRSALSDREEDIHDGSPYRVIDFSKYKDHLAFISLPKDRLGNVIPGSSYEGQLLTLPAGFSGEIRVSYLIRPEIPTDDGAQLNIKDAYLPLLTPLILSRILTEDDPELSERHASVYSDMVKSFGRVKNGGTEEKVITNGWA